MPEVNEIERQWWVYREKIVEEKYFPTKEAAEEFVRNHPYQYLWKIEPPVNEAPTC